MGRDSKHDAIRDYFENRDGRAKKINEKKHVFEEDDDLEAELDSADEGTEVIVHGTHQIAYKTTDKNDIHLLGADANARIECSTPDTPAIQLGETGLTSAVKGWRIENLRIDGREDELSHSASGGSDTSTTFFKNVENLRIVDCDFDQCHNRGISMEGAPGSSFEAGNYRTWIARNTFTNNSRNAMYVQADDLFVLNNYIADSPDTAIDGAGGREGSRTVISGNTIEQCKSGIIVNDTERGIIVSNNHVRGATAQCLSLRAGTANAEMDQYVVDGNLFQSDSGSHIMVVDDVDDISITSNMFVGDVLGLRIRESPEKVSVSGNTFIGDNSMIQANSNVVDLSIRSNSVHVGPQSSENVAIETECPGAQVCGNVIWNSGPPIRVKGDNSVVAYNHGHNVRRFAVDGADGCGFMFNVRSPRAGSFDDPVREANSPTNVFQMGNISWDEGGSSWFIDDLVPSSASLVGAQSYSESNVTSDRTFDADNTTAAELADVLGTLIKDLRSQGLVD